MAEEKGTTTAATRGEEEEEPRETPSQSGTSSSSESTREEGQPGAVPSYDREQRLLWETKIVVRVCLYEGDNGSIERVPDVYLSVSRQEYLYQTVFEKVIPLWRHVLPSSASRTPWLEYGMLPLKWDLPCGVLFDLHHQHDGDTNICNGIWTIIAHFSNFPSTMLTSFDVKESLRNHMFHSMKEASHVRVGSASRIMNMSGAAQDALWNAVRKGLYDEYAKVYSSLGLERSVEPSEHDKSRIPVRILVCRGTVLHSTSYEDLYMSSRSISNGSLKDCLYDIAMAWMKKASRECGILRICVGGIDMQGHEPLSCIWQAMHAPDGFLYIHLL